MLQPAMQTFSFSEAAKEVVVLQENIAEAKGIKVINRLNKTFTVYADLNMMKTVLRNLLSNAIKFSFTGGEIYVDGEEKDGYLTVSVKDKGQGISKEHQRDLFEDGLHFISYGTQKEKGSGLGLQLCKDFVKMNHGKIWFNSEEGKGTTFYFSVPVSDITLN